MPDKLTDSEIVKALENLCDKAFKELENPIKRKEKIKVWDILCKVLDLINRLQADCENYKQVAEYQQSVTMDRGFEIKRLQEKVNRLKQYDEERDIRLHARLIAEAKAEAYKECIEKVKEKANKSNWFCNESMVQRNYTITEEKLNNLLKELVVKISRIV